jgi:hypothetical protein
LGATLAALAAARTKDVERVVLWEPVVDGQEYLAALQALHREWLQEALREGRNARHSEDDLLGYQLTERLRRDFADLSLRSLAAAPAPSLYLITKGPSDEYERLVAILRQQGARVDADRVEGPEIWSKTPSMDESSVATGALRSIVTWLSSTSG